MGRGVETVQDLHVVIPDEQLLGQGPRDGLQERLTIRGIDTGSSGTVSGSDLHGDLKIGFDFHDDTPVICGIVGILHRQMEHTSLMMEKKTSANL